MPSDDCQTPPPEPTTPETLAALLDCEDAAFDEALEVLYWAQEDEAANPASSASAA